MEPKPLQALRYIKHIKEVTTELESNDWDTSHVSYCIWLILKQWWDARVSDRTLHEVQGVLNVLSYKFNSEITSEYTKKRKT